MTTILSLLTTCGGNEHTAKPNMQPKMYLMETVQGLSFLKETLTVCTEAQLGSFIEKTKYFEIVMGHLWFLSETVGRLDLHRKYLKAVVLSKTLQPLHPSRTSRFFFFASLCSFIETGQNRDGFSVITVN